MLALVIAIAAVSQWCDDACDDKPVPLVVESYDEVRLVTEYRSKQPSHWEYSRLYFIRGGKVIADRIICDDMLLTLDGQGCFVIHWNDYGNCNRIVSCKRVSEEAVDLDELDLPPDTQPWWGAGRRMTDLAQPGDK